MSDLAENKAIKFPKSHFIGYIGRPDQDDVPLAFMTEDGTDKAALKRKSTVEEWVRSNSYSRNNEKKIAVFRTYENKPLAGFRLSREVKRSSSFGSGNVVWRIEDPRGFELEISSPNFAHIATNCVIRNGEILDECVWARLRGNNILVPVSSPVYQTVQQNEARIASTVSMKDIERGDHVVLQNGDEGIYLGKFASFNRSYSYNSKRPLFEFNWSKRPVHAMLMKTKNYRNEDFTFIKTTASIKPSYVTKREGGPLSAEEAEQLAWSIDQSHQSEFLYLTQSEIEYTKEPSSLNDFMGFRRCEGNLIVKKDNREYRVSINPDAYAVYRGTKQPNWYRSDQHVPFLSEITFEDGQYYVEVVNHYHRPANLISFEELEGAELFILSGSLKTSDGKVRQLV